MYGLALASTVALLVATAYFLMGSVPLLVLKHDTPLDARFVRAFFNVYFLAAKVTASTTAVCFALSGRLPIAAGAAVLVGVATFQRSHFLPKMEAVEALLQTGGLNAVPGFRRLHMQAILTTAIQLVLIVGCLVYLGKSGLSAAAT
ncbi:MAG: hypothetical protein EOO27_12260 [Comamonadaceae bacterium]|nr:MAG: hypothetical protein EOO27_12260 [Comamonadaceae bacterium]